MQKMLYKFMKIIVKQLWMIIYLFIVMHLDLICNLIRENLKIFGSTSKATIL